MAVRIPVAPVMLRWALERSGRDRQDLAKAFPKLDSWLNGDLAPTLNQLEQFAQRTYTPLGFLFLDDPPLETLPLPDYRTMGGAGVGRPSPDLLDTIDTCEQRQDWFKSYALETGIEALDFVGSVTLAIEPVIAGADMRRALDFGVVQRREYGTWTDALFGLIEAAEHLGILVMVNGVVGNNTSRKLDPGEFRGFALADQYAPLIFINGADTKAAQIFTLAHELAHVWLGQSAVSKPDLSKEAENATERWCNIAAAEVLVPLDTFRPELRGPELVDDLERLAREYRVSTLVILRRLFDSRRLSWEQFNAEYDGELGRVIALAAQSGGGGQFYYTQPYRVSRRFASALIAQAHEGQTLYRDALRLLSLRKIETFERLGRYLGAA